MDLETFLQTDWHDAPLEAFRLGQEGLALEALLWNEELDHYDCWLIRFDAFEKIEVKVEGTLNLKELDDLEIFTMDVEPDENGHVTGEIEILPSNTGWWTFKVYRARVTVESGGVRKY